MAEVQFDARERYDLGAQIAAPFGAVLNPAVQAITTDRAALAALLERLARGSATVLPRRHGSVDEWIIVGDTRREIEAVLVGAGRFVVPTYAEHDGGVPTLRTFDPHGDDLERIAALLYQAGYYRWVAPPKHFPRMLERLALWSQLEDQRPQRRLERQPSYRDLLERFSAALSAGAWDDASASLDSMRRLGLSAADNLTFLEVQLLAQQRRWADIWGRRDFADIAQLRVPRAVRVALLTALHQSQLLELEQRGSWDEALEAFRRVRPRAGALLEGRADITFGPVARILAYQAIADADRQTIEVLLGLSIDQETRHVLDALAGFLPAPSQQAAPALPAATPQLAVRQALADGAFDDAVVAAARLESPVERATAMLEIAFLSDEPQLAEEALLQFWDLPPEAQEALRRSRKISHLVDLLSASVSTPALTSPEEIPRDWLGWLALANGAPDDPRLPRSLDAVAVVDDRYWTNERLVSLSDQLVELASSTAPHARPSIHEAVRYLRDYFLQDLEFPRDRSPYDEIYEALYLATLEQRDINERTSMALLRLAEARLRHNPGVRDAVARHLTAWFDNPFPALESVAQDALDLLAAYGIQGPTLAIWYRGWAEALLSAPGMRDRLSIEGWLDLGRWVQPGDDLLERLRSRLDDADEDQLDPVAALPTNYQIAIFTLRTESAERAGEMLRRRNSTLQIRVCDDTVLTDRARSLAQNSQLVVVVTTCITHALTYGIGPYRRDPVYPQSSGSTSILRAIETRLRQ